MEEEYGQAAETTMSFVLKLDVDVEATTASVVENVTKGGEGQPPTLLFAREIWRSQEPVAIATDTNNTSTGNAVMIASSDDCVAAACGGKSQLLQCLEAASNQVQQPTAATASALTTVKPVVTYPVAKGAREQVQKMIAGSQTNTTQVLTTRVISQKLPSSSSQAQPVPLAILNTSPVSTQSSLVASNMQALHPKFHPVSVQQHIVGTAAAVKTIATMATNLQRIQVKTGSSSVITSQSAQKGKTVTNTNQATQSAGAAQRNNSLSRAQNMQKSQMLTNQMNQLTVNNQTIANSKIQQTNPVIQKTTQSVNAQKSVCNNQASSQLLSSGHHPNHKVQQQQNLQKLQGPQKTLAMTRQQQLTVQQVNNVPKSSGPGLQKIQTQQQQPTANQQQVQAPHQRSQSTGLQKSQTILNTNRIPTTMSNVCKSNSVPNISKVPPQNSNVLGNKQSHAQPTSTQLQQQIVQTSQQQSIMQKSQQQQPTNANNLQAQRSHSITNMHQKVVASMSNNQRTHAVINSKIQQQQQPLQQMMMRVGISKGQAPQASQSTAGLKSVSQKMMNPVKVTANSQNNAVQQPVGQRNSPTMNIPTMKILAQQREQQLLQQQRQQQQQQHQNVINPQNAPQKQPGCIKTIPPQKPVQRNHAQKVGGSGIKTSLNTNVTALPKTQGSTAIQIAQKGCIKTLLQQTATVASSNIMAAHKSSPIKIQPQVMQQKQLIMTPQYTQQIRQQSGQIKTLLPVSSTMTENLRKDLIEIKNETELRISKEEEQSGRKSPVRRMPLPYECLQFVLQDHNYGAPPPRTPPPPPSSPPHPKQQPINGAGSSTATSQHPYIFGPVVSNTNTEDDAASTISSEAGREAEPEGEETETAPEGEGDDEDSVTRCICDFEHDDGYMICCDRCLVWQHVDCMGIDRSNIPDEYLCERCRPRRVDRQRARTLQMRKREELLNSDTSSDTSSTSSADTDVGSVNATVQKKRSLSQQQQQQQQPSSQIPRRGKSDAPTQSAQVRRLNNNNNNNNNVAKRQRRDSHARQSSAVRKKENATPKRGPGKRKAKRRMSLEDKEEDVQDAWGSNMAPLRQWIERYEEAVTNHYSPELRARISSIKVNGTHSDLRQTNMNVIATGKCRLNVHSNNLRFLVATMYLPPNTPVVELRGKYMLSTQHRSQHPQGGRQHAQRPGPFVFFYRLPRDGTEVCVDTRTYGNDARFVRRSCKPNAEVKHCIEKGTLHLYIVTTCAIEKNAEITIKHEQHDLLLSPNPGTSPALPVVCACNNPRECQIANAANQQLNRRGSNGALIENADGRERRRRGRRNTVCEETDPPAPPVPTSIAQQVTSTATSSAPSTVTVTTPRKTVTTTVTVSTTRQVPKEEPTATVTNVQPQSSPGLRESVATPETKKDKKKMTREERKMEAIMKAIERMEKAEQRRQEVQARNAQRKESSGTHSDNEDNNPTTGQSSKSGKQASSDRPLRRKRRKGRARTTSTSQSQNANNRRTRLNSAESDVSSGDESNSMQSPPLLGRPPSREVPYSSHLHTPAKNTVAIGDSASNIGPSSGGHHSGIPTAAGLLLALANSNVPGPPSSPPLQQPTPVKSPTCDSGASSSSQSSTPSTPLSSACLLVAAAVGPLAPGFKFPKTKKVLMNEWLKESPDPPQANVPQVSPLPALPSAPALPNSVNHPLCGRHFPPLPATDPTAEFLSQSYAAKSLATLVQAANSVSGICDSPPQRRQQQQAASTPCNNNNNNGGSSGGCPTGSAKKRWLRQAISEECDSPNSRPESPPSLSETVAPPKKRRIARESLSSENYTPPTTPTMLLPTEAASNNRSLCPAEDDYAERAQSPFVEQNDEGQYESESVKEEVNADGRPVDSDESVVRKKISVDTFSQSDFYVACNEEKCSDFSDIKAKISPVMSAESAAIKEEKVFPKWEKGDIKTECNYSSLDPKIFAKIQKVVESGVSFSDLNLKKEPFMKKEEQGTVEIIHHDISHPEIEGYPSPMEPDEILEQRVAELQLEFGGIDEISLNVASDENKKSENKSSETVAKCQEIVVEKSDDNASIDEFDVEAQMKKITGDDGNDYQEKIDTSSEKDKSMDGIEGLMESSKEDSDSEDKDMDDESSFKLFDMKHEEAPFNELDAKPDEKSEQALGASSSLMEDDVKEPIKGDANDEASKEAPKTESSTLTALSEESIFESASSNAESVLDPPKIFHSIPPLSERIRKKADPVAPKVAPKMDFEAAIIESTITMDTVEESTNGEEKSMLSTALRELLEAKLDDEPEVIKNDIDNEISASSQVAQPKSDISPERSLDVVQDSSTAQEAPKPEEAPPAKEEETKPKEIKRLKDPRTVVPNNMPAPPAFKPDALPPVKRKLSISEYRKRKQQSSGGAGAEPESSKDDSTDKSGARGRSDSTSSGTSSLSSDEEGSKASATLDLSGVTTLTLFPNATNENDEKKGLTAEAILKAHKSPPQNLVANPPPGYPGLQQLPPQPYIPPPGSASIHYPQFQSKPPVQYPNFAMPPQTTSSTQQQPSQAGGAASKQAQQQFLVPQASQAPPGSNPYPPPQFVPPPPPPAVATAATVATASASAATTGTTVPKFSSTTPPPPPGNQAYPPPTSSGQPQKPFFNHPAPPRS